MMSPLQYTFKRYEKKYLLTPAQYKMLYPKLTARMARDIYGVHTICNIYYDTEHYELICTSVDKPPYKEKFRLRSYGIPDNEDDIFAEIKKKFDGIVYKRRVAAQPEAITDFMKGQHLVAEDAQIQREIRWFLDHYRPEPKVFIGYERKALIGTDDLDLRITFDWNMRFREFDLDLRCGDKGRLILPEKRIVMEVKTASATPLWLVSLLSEHKIYPQSFSKYGTCFQRYIASDLYKKKGRINAQHDYNNADDLVGISHLSRRGHGSGCADSAGVFVQKQA